MRWEWGLGAPRVSAAVLQTQTHSKMRFIFKKLGPCRTLAPSWGSWALAWLPKVLCWGEQSWEEGGRG